MGVFDIFVCFQAGTVKVDDITPQELIAIIDDTLACFVSVRKNLFLLLLCLLFGVNIISLAQAVLSKVQKLLKWQLSQDQYGGPV